MPAYELTVCHRVAGLVLAGEGSQGCRHMDGPKCLTGNGSLPVSRAVESARAEGQANNFSQLKLPYRLRSTWWDRAMSKERGGGQGARSKGQGAKSKERGDGIAADR